MKTIIITGGTSGIGLNLAEYFYRRNYNISVAGKINRKQIEKIKKKFHTKRSLFFNLDLIKKKILKNLLKSQKKNLKKLIF